jgi:ethanolamine ammonia-lyase large subunit
MAWCGAEATFPFANERELVAARTFLSSIAVVHLQGDRLPPGMADEVTDYYVFDDPQRTAFEKFMRERAPEGRQ